MSFCDLSGKKIIVTGASSGLGRATCLLLSNLGATIVLMGRDERRLHGTMDRLAGEDHLIVPFDLNGFDGYKAKFDLIREKIGRLDGVVHFAGLIKLRPLNVQKVIGVQEMLDIHLVSFLELVKNFMRKKVVHPNGGAVVVASTVAALRGASALSGYAASKAAVDGAVRSLACELAPKNIRVNSIAPGHIETEKNIEMKQKLSKEAYENIINSHPLGLGYPEDVANTVAFLMSNEAKWITGVTVPVDGGFTARS